MKKLSILFLLLAICALNTQLLLAQAEFKTIVKDKTSGLPLKGAFVVLKSDSAKSSFTNEQGFALLKNVPQTGFEVACHYLGYTPVEIKIKLPDTSIHIIYMEAGENAVAVIISSTRSNEKIESSTTKIEVLGPEEIAEESTLKPGNILGLLGDISGIQMQQTSPISGNSNIRIQGLDGRYTQMLRDGMPLYDGFSGGFGVLSIPPLDLKQLEIIKGSASTLYGGGAIGGLINFISKRPTFSPDATFIINQTTLDETNINAYYAQRWQKLGFTMFLGENIQQAKDVNKDGFSDVPKLNSTLIHPVFFFYPSSTSIISLGWTGSFEQRKGGDMAALAGGNNPSHPYFESDLLDRNTATLIAEKWLTDSIKLSLKGNYSIFNRDINTNTYSFKGLQNSYYSEASFSALRKNHNIVGGINFTGYEFIPSSLTPILLNSFTNNTLGGFIQDTWQLNKSAKVEAGLRIDQNNHYGTFTLPRIAFFDRLNKHWGIRSGFGMGYKTPDPLTPQILDQSINTIQPIANTVSPEKAYGANLELNYKKEWSKEASIFINHAFFFTQINNPVIGEQDSSGVLSFHNERKPILTSGFDTYIKATLEDLEIYTGYTYTNAERKYLAQNQFMPLSPLHKVAVTVVYEIEGEWKMGADISYNSFQYRDGDSKTPGYYFFAAMIEKKFKKHLSLVLNCENLLDVRQSRYEALYYGSITNPQFKPLWAPIDGRVFNLALKLKL